MIINPYIFLSTNPLWDGLQAYYTADNTPNDALGSNNGTLVNGATYGTGIINQGFSLDGANDYISLPDDSFKPLNDFSVSFWVNIDGSSTNTIFCSQWAANGFRVDILENDKVFFRFWDSSGSQYDFTSTGTITRNTLQMVTVTKDSLNGLKVYINGSFDSGNSVIVDIGYHLSNITYVSIGTARYLISSFVQYFQGIIDEASLLTDVLTSSEVTQLYNSGAGLQYS